jgi:DNA-binding LacI/PurR family transcriptional regulator
MTQHQPGQDQPDDARPSRRRASRLIDIAEAVGVHTSTVSRVLNGDPAQSVRPEIYEKIWRAARQQGYRPNALARALKRRRTGALTFVIPLLRNPIWVRLQRGALQRASERGYVVMIMEEPGDDPQPPASYRYLVEESRADGLLLATSLRIPAHADGGPLGGLTPVPHVYVNRRGPERGNDVVMDEPGAVRLFVDHVAGLGHRSVALIDGPSAVDTVHRRAMAARRICAGRGMQLTVLHADATEEGGWLATERLLRRGTRGRGTRASGNQAGANQAGANQAGANTGRGTLPTAWAVGSLNQMFGVMAALRAAGLAVPADVSVVSLDEDECLAFLDVPVTSVAMPLAELGSAAVDALIARIDQGEPGEPGDVMIREPMSLVLRRSVAGPPSGRPGQGGR